MVFVAEFVVKFAAEVVLDEFAGAGKVIETKSEDAAEFVVDFMKEGVVAVVAELSAVGDRGDVTEGLAIEEDVTGVSVVALEAAQ